MHEFDPYDFLMQITERQQRMENAHNRLAQAFEENHIALQHTRNTLNNLQRRHMEALARIDALEGERINAQLNTTTINTTQT